MDTQRRTALLDLLKNMFDKQDRKLFMIQAIILNTEGEFSTRSFKIVFTFSYKVSYYNIMIDEPVKGEI